MAATEPTGARLGRDTAWFLLFPFSFRPYFTGTCREAQIGKNCESKNISFCLGIAEETFRVSVTEWQYGCWAIRTITLASLLLYD